MSGKDLMRALRRAATFLTAMLVGLILLIVVPQARAADVSQQNGAQILQQFDQQQVQRVGTDKLSEHRKHVIIFLLGFPLIIMLLITGGLGVAMGIYGKQQLFAVHMVFAVLSITLALVHAVVSVIWFFPF